MSAVEIFEDAGSGVWAQELCADYTVSVFKASTIIRFSPRAAGIQLQGTDADVVSEWADMRAAVYSAGPDALAVQQAIDRCRAALAEAAEKVAPDDAT